MAFISTPLPSIHASTSTSTCPHMTQTKPSVTRRTALRLAAFSVASIATSALAQSAFDLKELKEDVEELNYEEEVTDVGPDAAEKNVTRIKKKQEEPTFRSEEAALRKEEETKYEEMLAKQKAENEKLKQEFSK